jgi:predicted transcriptional regulator of viral defense system
MVGIARMIYRYTLSEGMLMQPSLIRSYSTNSGGIRRGNRRALETLHRAGGPLTVAEAAELLGVDAVRARRLLGYLARRGWLTRVRRGLYTPVPLEAQVSGEWSEDAWVAAAAVFSPCYIGGWSAAEHWDLTEQLFRTLLVFTARRVRNRDDEIQGTPVRLKVIPEAKLFGARPVWRHRARVSVSDPSRTVVDMLNDPSVGGGMHHIAAVVTEYFSTEHRNDDLLIEYGDRLRNRSIFKRLGYVLEAEHIPAPKLAAACLSRRSTGISALDPTVDAKGRILRRWGLRINVDLSAGEGET